MEKVRLSQAYVTIVRLEIVSFQFYPFNRECGAPSV